MYVDIRNIVIVLVAVAVIQKEQLEELHLREMNTVSIVNLANLKSIKPTFHPRKISLCQIPQMQNKTVLKSKLTLAIW